MTFEEIREIVLSFPGVEEHLSFGRPTYYINKRLLACIARIDADALVVKLYDPLEREYFLTTHPDIYYCPDQYISSDALLVRIPLAEPDELREILLQTWQRFASKRRQTKYTTNS